MFIIRIIALFLLIGINQVQAHTASDSFLTIKNIEDKLLLQWDIALRDLDFVLGLDTNRDSQLSGAEIKTKASEITAHALGNIAITNNQQLCELKLESIHIIERDQQQYFSINSQGNCRPEHSITIDYRLFSDIDPTHRGLINYQSADKEINIITTQKNPTVTINTNTLTNNTLAEKAKVISSFIIEGIWHIWIGIDHIIFLLTLLLPAVALTQGKKQALKNGKQAFFAVIKLVTCFTVAHSITLSLATLNIVILPSRWVEVVIAASIIVVALNNIKPLFNHARLWFAFVFGLIHGFGFANVLLDLELQAATLALSLFSFNIGVELGQIAIILIAFPLLYALSYWARYRYFFIPTMSSAFAAIAILWVVERSTGYEINIF
ncbi:MAG: HupE/UreJ family protein [Cellvibrionaceae bacterium]